MFVRLLGKHQVGNLLLAALQGMIMQRLGADFELATRIGSMADFKCQLQVADGKWDFCF